ncbi:hypothetical protein LTR53_016702, partial [Teratosphaeriaceae sp. CCFEE 6253]
RGAESPRPRRARAPNDPHARDGREGQPLDRVDEPGGRVRRRGARGGRLRAGLPGAGSAGDAREAGLHLHRLGQVRPRGRGLRAHRREQGLPRQPRGLAQLRHVPHGHDEGPGEGPVDVVACAAVYCRERAPAVDCQVRGAGIPLRGGGPGARPHHLRGARDRVAKVEFRVGHVGRSRAVTGGACGGRGGQAGGAGEGARAVRAHGGAEDEEAAGAVRVQALAGVRGERGRGEAGGAGEEPGGGVCGGSAGEGWGGGGV